MPPHRLPNILTYHQYKNILAHRTGQINESQNFLLLNVTGETTNTIKNKNKKSLLIKKMGVKIN